MMSKRESAATELEKWWLGQAQEEIERTVPKALEYGSGDLIEIGRTMAKTKGDDHIGDKEAAELGVYFYLVGKIARWTDAIRNGRRVSDDTLFDIGVYIRMAQRIRAAGGWPGVDLDELAGMTADELVQRLRSCCRTFEHTDHLKGCKAVAGEETICTCEPDNSAGKGLLDPGCPTHGSFQAPCTCTEEQIVKREEDPFCPRHGD